VILRRAPLAHGWMWTFLVAPVLARLLCRYVKGVGRALWGLRPWLRQGESSPGIGTSAIRNEESSSGPKAFGVLEFMSIWGSPRTDDPGSHRRVR
jgi:hypothetical protein